MPASLPAVGKWTPAPDQAGRGAAGLGHHPPGGIAGVLEEGFQGEGKRVQAQLQSCTGEIPYRSNTEIPVPAGAGPRAK